MEVYKASFGRFSFDFQVEMLVILIVFRGLTVVHWAVNARTLPSVHAYSAQCTHVHRPVDDGKSKEKDWETRGGIMGFVLGGGLTELGKMQLIHYARILVVPHGLDRTWKGSAPRAGPIAVITLRLEARRSRR